MQLRVGAEGAGTEPQRTEGDQAKAGNYIGHTPPDREYIERNKLEEPEGERIRAELEDFIKRNHIVGIFLDTDHHRVHIDIDRLPPRIKSVLTKWGAISIRDWPGEITAKLQGRR